jgi:LCP family protein required for cell wall assembly
LTLAIVVVVSGIGGGLFLWFHQSLAAIRAHSPALKLAQRELNAPLPGQPAIALLLGDNQRAGLERSAGGRSDTIMLVRADPQAKTISLLSLPRDLRVPVWCPHNPQPLGDTRIDYAFAYCGPAGSLETVQKLTGLRINYLITVNFHGFKEIVNDLGGIWLDVDRRYFNQNVGTAATDYSNINLEPG